MLLHILLSSLIPVLALAQFDLYPMIIEFPTDVTVTGNVLQLDPSGTYTPANPPIYTPSPNIRQIGIIIEDSPGSGQVVQISMSGEGVPEPTITVSLRTPPRD
jgi:hypothetical protein